ncbi:putative transposon, En/Spm-like, transposase-associated domain protein, partial [Tanacetum coccineum]
RSFLLRELKTVKADLAFAKERCGQLEEENRIPRECGGRDGDNPEDEDLIRSLQLESPVTVSRKSPFAAAVRRCRQPHRRPPLPSATSPSAIVSLSSPRGKGKDKDKDRDKDNVGKDRVEGGRENSLVEFDVSFQSNGLVAKVVATPSSLLSDTLSRNRKNKRGSEFGSHVSKFGERLTRSGSSSHGVDSPSISEKPSKTAHDEQAPNLLSKPLEEQASNSYANEYYDMLEADDEPLYEGCQKYSTLEAATRLLNWKAEGNVPEATYNRALSIFKDMLPSNKQPLIKELKMLWNSGVETYDAYRKNNFHLKAALLWTVSDFPAYAMLSGWSTHGKLSCPHCMGNVDSFQLENRGKPSGLPLQLTGDEIWEQIRYLLTVYEGKPYRPGNKKIDGFGHWVKRSIFWELPYWHTLLIRHNLDLMHIEKNFLRTYFIPSWEL